LSFLHTTHPKKDNTKYKAALTVCRTILP